MTCRKERTSQSLSCNNYKLMDEFETPVTQIYLLLAARPAFGGPLASRGATPPGPPFDSMPVSWMKSAYYN